MHPIQRSNGRGVAGGLQAAFYQGGAESPVLGLDRKESDELIGWWRAAFIWHLDAVQPPHARAVHGHATTNRPIVPT